MCWCLMKKHVSADCSDQNDEPAWTSVTAESLTSFLTLNWSRNAAGSQRLQILLSSWKSSQCSLSLKKRFLELPHERWYSTAESKNYLQTDEALWRLFCDITVAPGGQLTITVNQDGEITRRVKQQHTREIQSAIFKSAVMSKTCLPVISGTFLLQRHHK